jgi:hypothetical protein
MQMLKFIAGRNKLMPLNEKLLTRGLNICFREVSFGVSYKLLSAAIDWGLKEGIYVPMLKLLSVYLTLS